MVNSDQMRYADSRQGIIAHFHDNNCERDQKFKRVKEI